MRHGHGAGSLGKPAQSQTMEQAQEQLQEKVHQCGVDRRSRSRLLLGVEQNKLMSWRRVNRVYEAGIERG